MRSMLSRNCQSCIRAKKRCSRALPRCARCSKKRLPCSYQNEPLSRATDPVEQLAQAARGASLPSNGHMWPGGLPNRRRFWNSHRGEIYWSTGQSILRMTEPVMFLPMDAESHAYIVHGLTLYPLQFKKASATGFIHQQAYQRFRPASLTITQAICRVRLDRYPPVNGEAAAELADLVQSLLSIASSTVSFIDTLAFVQSLCLLQIMALFLPDATEEEIAEGLARQDMLVEWTQKLWKCVPSELPNTLSKHEAYVLAEAVRRTILTSHKIQGSYRVAKTGFFRHTLFVETLPFGGNTILWEGDQLVDMMETKYPQLLSYRELCDMFDAGEIQTATHFERMLLVGCKGKAAVEERLGPLR